MYELNSSRVIFPHMHALMEIVAVPIPPLTVRNDDFSIQITSRLSNRFYIRVDTDNKNHLKIVYTDFIIEVSDNKLALSAVDIISSMHKIMHSGMQIEFLNIYPLFPTTRDKIELTRRHDQIVHIFHEYLISHQLSIINSYLRPINGLFDTVLVLS